MSVEDSSKILIRPMLEYCSAIYLDAMDTKGHRNDRESTKESN